MAWFLKPDIPNDATFSGQMVFGSESIEISDVLKKYIDSISYTLKSELINKKTGFATNKYRLENSQLAYYNIILKSSISLEIRNALQNLAIAVNGGGVAIKINDDFIAGTTSAPIEYTCRWLNAGDFVDNNELFCGGSIELLAFVPFEAVVILEYQKVIDVPPSLLEWDLQISHSNEYNRII